MKPWVRRFAASLSVTFVALAGVAAIGAPADAIVPGTNGRILFARCVWASTCTWEIVAADANDAKETVLAGPYPREAWDDHFTANWSPDGKTAIFMAYQQIWQVNADGTGLHVVWSPPNDGTGIDDGPTFTPDGKHIVFTRCCPQNSGYGLWMIDADGSDLRIVTTEAVGPNVDGPSDNLPQVSPNGKLIAFHRNLNYCGCYIATVNMSGGDMRQLTPISLNGQNPNWSPDGKRIVFQMDGPSGGIEVGIVNANGTGLKQLTFGNGKVFNFAPTFSPDGTKIIFTRTMPGGGTDLFTMNPDGSEVKQITTTAAAEFWPQWATA